VAKDIRVINIFGRGGCCWLSMNICKMETETYPYIVETFYTDCQVVHISKDKSSLKGNCKKCKKTITGG
jgi:hypothetical protein